MLRRLSPLALILLLIAVAAYLLALWPLRDPHPAPRVVSGKLVIRDVKIYISPSEPPIEHGRVAIASGVDVLARAPDSTDGIDAQLLQTLVRKRMAMMRIIHALRRSENWTALDALP